MRPARAHLIGALGSGMRSLGEVLAARGWLLTGSDTAAACELGISRRVIAIHAGHRPDNVPRDADLVIHSAAVTLNNPERVRADDLGIPQCSYPQMLGKLMHERRGLAIAGTHGKSTVAAMTAAILCQAGLDPTVVAGGTPLGSDSGGRHGAGEWMVAEACEYRRHFLELSPEIAVVLNIEPDHFDCYASQTDLEDAFARFVRRVPPGGLVLSNADCPATQRIAAGLACRHASFGLSPAAHWRAVLLDQRDGRYAFQVTRCGKGVCRIVLRVPGRFQVYNALAAAAAAWEAGASAAHIQAGLNDFGGLWRRLETVADRRGVTLIDDYAHHPTEVAATLAALRQAYPGRPVWCVFQPHQASRTHRLLDEFAASLQNADCVAIASVFRARESPDERPSATAADLACATRARAPWSCPSTIRKRS